MSKRVLELYQYIAPAVLAPLSFWLWWRHYDGDIWLVLMAWMLPIVYAYVVPGVGTNVLKVSTRRSCASTRSRTCIPNWRA